MKQRGKKARGKGKGRSPSAVPGAHPNPLRVDPTRTVTLRRALMTAVRQRFARLKLALVRLVAEEDAFGLAPRTQNPFALLSNAFCPTGEGGGVDPSCSPGGRSGSEAHFHTPAMRETTARMATELVKGMVADGNEHGAVVDRDGNVLWRGKGAPDELAIPADLGNREDVALIHTHPTDVSFTAGDWVSQLRNPNAVFTAESASTSYQLTRSRDAADVRERVARTTDQEIIDQWWGYAREFVRSDVGRKLPPRARAEKANGYASRKMAEQYGFSYQEYPREPAVNQRWAFQGTSEQVAAFKAWLRAQIDGGLVGDGDRQLWEGYVRAAFERGAGRSWDDAKRLRVRAGRDPSDALLSGAGIEPASYLGGQKAEFMRRAVASPALAEKVRLLTQRSFTDLEGVTDQMAAGVTRALAEGLARGLSPREVARSMAKAVDLGKDRALLVARSEMIRSHAEGQLDALEAMGVREVGVQVEWATAGDEKVCSKCEAFEGVVLPIEEARGRIPAHPNCRCAWIPASLGPEGEEPEAERTRDAQTAARAGAAELEGGEAVTSDEDEEWELEINSRPVDPLEWFDALWNGGDARVR